MPTNRIISSKYIFKTAGSVSLRPIREDSLVKAILKIRPSGSLFKLKVENGKSKITVGGVPPHSIREDS